MVAEKFINQIKNDFLEILKERNVLGLMLFGSYVNDTSTNRSDIDLCVIAPEEDPQELFSLFAINIDIVSTQYDIKFFSILPLYLQIQVIEEGEVIYSPDELELYEYFYPFRKLWADQRHRQELSKDELISLLD